MAQVLRLILALISHDRGSNAAPIIPPVTPPLSIPGSFSLDFNDDFDVGS